MKGNGGGETTKGTCELIKLAKENSLNVMLKPHVWVMGEGWTGDFNLLNEEDWLVWEKNYSEYILHYAEIADSLDVGILCIGTEYRVPAKERPLFWKQLIQKVKHKYSGKLTYAANWDNFYNISWWNELDYIGIDSYFPLVEKDNPSIIEINRGWQPIKNNLASFSKKWDKPILFTEFGFQSVNGGAGRHWEVVKSANNVNTGLQKNAYSATFQSIWNEPWFAGGFLWKWHLTDHGMERRELSFTPQGKPALEVITRWYGAAN